MIEFTEIEGVPDEPTFEKIEQFYASIFERVEPGKFQKRMREAVAPLTVLAVCQGEIAGFKCGYEIGPAKFYSWVGGVGARFRQQGIAAELMRRQHDRCLANGYEIVRTKTKNCFKAMLILNLKSGFDITEVYRDRQGELKIILEKNLKLFSAI